MNNIYQPKIVKVTGISRESADTHLIRFKFADARSQANFSFLPGQFMQVGFAGWGECPISICSSPSDSAKFFELAIRDVGQLTRKLNGLAKGDEVLARGPFGNGFDVDRFANKDLLIIGGGCGFVPLRPLIQDILVGRIISRSSRIFYGCQNEDTLLFKSQYGSWAKHAKLDVILDKPSARWQGAKGLVTDLIKKADLAADAAVVMVGPPVMYKFAIKELLKKGIKPESIFLSLERKMYCGYGVCQHCAIGPYYVCKDGPVFTYEQLRNIPDAI